MQVFAKANVSGLTAKHHTLSVGGVSGGNRFVFFTFFANRQVCADAVIRIKPACYVKTRWCSFVFGAENLIANGQGRAVSVSSVFTEGNVKGWNATFQWGVAGANRQWSAPVVCNGSAGGVQGRQQMEVLCANVALSQRTALPIVCKRGLV
jgi:hypothetical protein